MAAACYILGIQYGFGGHIVFVRNMEVVAIVSIGIDYQPVMRLILQSKTGSQTWRGFLYFHPYNSQVLGDLTL